MSAPAFYPARGVKRRRATKAEMEERAEFLIEYAEEHGPVTVASSTTSRGPRSPRHRKRRQRLRQDPRASARLRREGRLDYGYIADMTRWMRKPRSFDSVEDALAATTRTYRKNLWLDSTAYVEVWCEKDALGGVIYPVTYEYDVPLMVARGFVSETFAYEAIAARRGMLGPITSTTSATSTGPDGTRRARLRTS